MENKKVVFNTEMDVAMLTLVKSENPFLSQDWDAVRDSLEDKGLNIRART